MSARSRTRVATRKETIVCVCVYVSVTTDVFNVETFFYMFLKKKSVILKK